MPIIDGAVFTCAACERTNEHPIIYQGPEGDLEAALKYVTGCYPASDPKDPPKRRGPICWNCLEQWKKGLLNWHFERCKIQASLFQEKNGGAGMVFTPHLRITGEPSKGTWIDADGRWQEIPLDARSPKPKPHEWKKGKATT